jgi:hypothetical protein
LFTHSQLCHFPQTWTLTQDAEWKTNRDVRETLLKDEDSEMIVGQDDAEGGLYDNEEGDDEYGEDTEGADEDWNDADDYGEDAGDLTFRSFWSLVSLLSSHQLGWGSEMNGMWPTTSMLMLQQVALQAS